MDGAKTYWVEQTILREMYNAYFILCVESNKKKQRKSKDYEEVEDEQCQKTRTIYAVLYVDCSV